MNLNQVNKSSAGKIDLLRKEQLEVADGDKGHTS